MPEPVNTGHGALMTPSPIAQGLGTHNLTLELPPSTYATLEHLARETGQPLEDVFTKMIALYKASLDARREGHHVGITDQAESLMEEFVGLGKPGGRL